jgi:hypothetical protein
MERKEGRGRPGAPNSQQEGTPQKEQAKPKRQSELDKFLELEEKEGRNRLFRAYPPEWTGIDPVGQPYKSMKVSEFNLSCRIREKAQDKALVEKLTSLKESLEKVSTAYGIIAYPFCKQRDVRDAIEISLEEDTRLHKKTKVELNDEELELVSKLTAVRDLPFDPEKRVYGYSEVSGYSPTGERNQKSSLFERYVTCRRDDE